MASYKEKFVLKWEISSVMFACQQAAANMKWKTVSQDKNKIVIRESLLQDKNVTVPVTIEVRVIPLSGGTGVEITASNIGIGAGPTDRVHADLETFRGKMHYELEAPLRMARHGEEIRVRQEMEDAKQQAQEQQERKEREMRQMLAKERQEREKLKEAAKIAQEPEPAAEQRRAFAAPPAPQPSLSSPDIVADLEKLSKLHQLGALSDSEFTEAKRKLLSL